MNDSLCRQLDEYLAGALSSEKQDEFAAHLSRCASCRGEVEAQRRLDELLRIANRRVELLPQFDLLLARRVRRSNLRRAAAWATASALLLAATLSIGWLIGGFDDELKRESNRVVHVPPPPLHSDLPTSPDSNEPPAAASPAEPPRVVVRANGGAAIALRVESAHPTVHIYRWLPAQPLATASSRSEPLSIPSSVEDEL